MDITLIGNTALRAAIRRNLVSFPSQIPSFMRRRTGEAQERIVQLYFIRGWSIKTICARYELSKAMAQKLLNDWKIRAISAGYIQSINPEALDALAANFNAHRPDAPPPQVTPEPVLAGATYDWTLIPPPEGSPAIRERLLGY